MNPGKKRIVSVGLSAIAAVWVLIVGWLVRDRFELRRADAFQTVESKPSGGGPLPVLWKAPAFSALDQRGQVVTEKALGGHVWIADFIFTRCTTACPLISAKMLLLRKAIVAPDIRFVSFSVDPDFDTPAVLSDYARRWNADPRWLLLSSKPSDVQDVARGMKVPLERTRDPDNPIMHTTFFFLVDSSGSLRGIYDSLDDDAIKRLVKDAQRLDGVSGSRSPEPIVANGSESASSADRGHALFDSVGCAACHSDSRVAPPLAGLFGRIVRFEGGATAMADEVYLRESIVDPNVHVVAGYSSLMPSYREHLSDAQITDLVSYVRSIPAAAGPAPEAVASAPQAQAIDPVCGMQVRAAVTNPHLQYKGKTYYFCSDTCLDRFSKAPEKYVPAATGASAPAAAE